MAVTSEVGHDHRCSRSRDHAPSRPIRGLLWGALFSIPLWVILVLLVRWLLG